MLPMSQRPSRDAVGESSHNQVEGVHKNFIMLCRSIYVTQHIKGVESLQITTQDCSLHSYQRLKNQLHSQAPKPVILSRLLVAKTFTYFYCHEAFL
jgi:hypothetical protein